MNRVNKQSNSEELKVEATKMVRTEGDRREDQQIRTQPQRKRRNSFGSPKLTLAVNFEIPGYHMCWKNDYKGELEDSLESGYEFVFRGETEQEDGLTPSNIHLGDKIQLKVGTKENGDPMYAYLMKIKQEWHEEDMAEVANQNRAIEEAIQGGNIQSQVGMDGKYVSNISIRRT